MFRFRAISLALAVATIVVAATASDAQAGRRGSRGGTVIYTTQVVPVVRYYPTIAQPLPYPYSQPLLYPYPYPYPYTVPTGRTVFVPMPY